jgi:hypothetical protein
LDELLDDCHTLKSLIGDSYFNIVDGPYANTIDGLIKSIRKLQRDVNNPDLLSDALDRAKSAKVLAYGIR